MDTLRCRGFIGNRRPISPMSKKYKKELERNYKDQRCQCYMMMSKLVNDRKIAVRDSSISKQLIEELDLVAVTNMDKDEPIRITSTDEIMGKLRRSPDYSSAFITRMFFDIFLREDELPVIPEEEKQQPIYMKMLNESIEAHVDNKRNSVYFA